MVDRNLNGKRGLSLFSMICTIITFVIIFITLTYCIILFSFGMYTAFMVNKVELSVNDAYKNYTENDSGLLLKQLNGEKYLRFKDDLRMQKIIEKLTHIEII